ncbi:hem oxygenase-like, multi-helical [Cordyceps militaris CM01]|uniref:Hem oxygenase-like, multi-helical n=1 Tax=Cordyceps militaris (strain CM01) TaxID=983644 RepID=G3J8U8_CORMM|nr:hem oxygenase-like, multi-helical [Cordyceps militaris CM01]EGX94831.1 hem oxygenase-like, multi-helical [Cordyceps militaris CM01]
MTSSTSSDSQPHRGQEKHLAEAIAAQTRGIHARLNKSILARLPLALPPRASDPSTYVTGLLHIAPIYLTFESLWEHLLAPRSEDGLDPHAELVTPLRPASKTATVGTSPLSAPALLQHKLNLPARVHSVLHALHLPGLARGDCLKADIRELTGWSDHVLDSQLANACRAPALSAMVDHMRISIQKQPLLLVTYTYIMYMALFAGGRFIRSTLESTGDEFWQTPMAPVKPTMQPCIPMPDVQREIHNDSPSHNGSHKCHPLPLSFFHFDTPHDGEDLKVEFKRRVRICEAALEPDETQAIVEEASNIFQHMISIVQQLDAFCEDDTSESAATTHGDYSLSAPLLGRLRDSVAVAKERHARTSPRTSSSEDDSAGTVIRRRNHHSSASSDSHTTESGASEHPPVPAVTRVQLCPMAAVRSVRFNSALSLPHQNEQVAWAGRREQIKAADLTRYVLAALLGIVAVGVVLLSRPRSMA